MEFVTRKEFDELRLKLEFMHERLAAHRGMLAVILTMAPEEDRERIISDLQFFLANDRKMNAASGLLAEKRELIEVIQRVFEQFPFVRRPHPPRK